MELYYFVEKNGGKKQGPYQLTDLKKQIIYPEQLIWHSDNEQWKKVFDFAELQGAFIMKPPLTPNDQKIADINASIIKKTLKNIVLIYFFTSLILSILSYVVASSSLEKFSSKYKNDNNSTAITTSEPG
jgi:hypothetical protein